MVGKSSIAKALIQYERWIERVDVANRCILCTHMRRTCEVTGITTSLDIANGWQFRARFTNPIGSATTNAATLTVT